MKKLIIVLAFLVISCFVVAQEVATPVGFIAKWQPWIFALTSVVTACTAITALTPTNVDNKIIAIVLKVLNLFAGNVLKNKNKDV